jgi:hypothetical protein
MDQDNKPIIQYNDPRDYKNEQLKKFLKKISMIESSGGKNLNHPEITDPESIHYGTSAVGEYGLMPLTAKDLDRKYRLNELQGLDKFEAQARLEDDPDLARLLAETMASDLLSKANSEKAAYMWEKGQYSNPSEQTLKASDRVRKFKALSNVK